MAPKEELINERYEPIRTLGGGMGVVSICYDHKTQSRVGLKTFKQAYASSRSARKEFLREAQTCINLPRHPHIVSTLRFEQDRFGDGCLVFEAIEPPPGEECSSASGIAYRNAGLSANQVQSIGYELASAMDAITDIYPDFVHRDIKPGNILIAKNGAAKLSDFGIATGVHEKPVSKSRRLRGTFAYLAPELWQGTSTANVKTDIYALGCTLLTLLKGKTATRRTFDSDDNVDPKEAKKAMYRARHLDGLNDLVPDEISATLKKIIRKCISFSPDNRYSDWHTIKCEMADDLGLPAEITVSEAGARSFLSGDDHKVGSLIGIGNSYIDLGYMQEARTCFDNLLEDFHDRLSEKQLIEVTGNLGYINTQTNSLSPGLDMLVQAVDNPLCTDTARVSLITRLGNVYLQLNQYENAYHIFLRGLTLSQEIRDEVAISNMLSNLGSIMLLTGNTELAFEFFEEDIKVAEHNGDISGQIDSLLNLARSHLQLKNKHACIHYAAQSIELAKMYDLHGEASSGSLVLAYCHANDGSLTDLQKTLDDWGAEFLLGGSEKLRYRELVDFAQYHFDRGNLPVVEVVTDRILNLANEKANETLLGEDLREKAQSYAEKSDYDELLKALRTGFGPDFEDDSRREF
ncbi:MAG: protein kinase [Pseudomonadota bacterium]